MLIYLILLLDYYISKYLQQINHATNNIKNYMSYMLLEVRLQLHVFTKKSMAKNINEALKQTKKLQSRLVVKD